MVLWPIEEILNRLIASDSYVSERLRPFDGKLIEVHCQAPSLNISVLFDYERLKLSAVDSVTLQLTPDARISGKSADLLQLLNRSDQQPLANTAISIEGDAQLVQDLYNTLNNLDLDWEDYLAPILGDVATNELGQFSSNARNWSAEAGRSMHRNVDDYLKEEARLVPGREEVDSFNDSLDRLRLNIDRVKARADRLQSRLDPAIKL